MFWNEENVGRLRALWTALHSASTIARQLGCTRNAVIGKAHRLGLYREYPVKEAREGSRPRRLRTSELKKPLPIPGVEKPMIPAAEMVGILDLTRRTCRFPMWNKQTPKPLEVLYCGETVIDGLPYCKKHCKECYVSAAAAKAAKRVSHDWKKRIFA